MAQKAGYLNGKVAQTRYGQIRKKVQSLVGENEQVDKVKKENASKPKPKAKPSKTAPRKAAGEDESVSPGKGKARAGPRVKLEDDLEASLEEEYEEYDDEEV